MYISDFKEEGQCILVAFTPEELKVISSTLHALGQTWEHDPGMNIGSSKVYDVYPSDLDVYFRFSVMVELNDQVQKILKAL